MLDQLTALKDSIEFISQQYDELLKDIADNNKKVEQVQKENRALKGEIASLKTSVKILYDQRVKNGCIVRSVEVKNDTNAIETVLDISKNVGISF